jgi:hypothetical protein
VIEQQPQVARGLVLHSHRQIGMREGGAGDCERVDRIPSRLAAWAAS